ncbi:MAG: ABC transporter ATP-binding protein [Candidatus Bathyarchaeia archaeon]
MASVRFENVSKSFGDKRVLHNLTFEVRDKEFFCILGPPGAGKTTTLKLIAGLERADEGDIYIGGQRVNDLPPRHRDVSMQFESLTLFPNKSGYENIAFPLRVRGRPENEIKESVLRVARLLKIEHILDREPRTFSGGERQRVALARAIVRRPKVILLDEPLSNIDALLRLNMRVELKRLAREIGQTIIFSTHDQAEAMSMAQRVLVLYEGQVHQIGAPEELYNRPADTIVAKMMGSPPMNLMECSYEGGKLSSSVFLIDAGRYSEYLAGATSNEMLLGVRPEDLKLSDRPSSENAFKVKIFSYEPLGAKTLVKVATEDGGILDVIGEPWMKYEMDREAWLDFDLDKIHLFDRRSGKILV